MGDISHRRSLHQGLQRIAFLLIAIWCCIPVPASAVLDTVLLIPEAGKAADLGLTAEGFVVLDVVEGGIPRFSRFDPFGDPVMAPVLLQDLHASTTRLVQGEKGNWIVVAAALNILDTQLVDGVGAEIGSPVSLIPPGSFINAAPAAVVKGNSRLLAFTADIIVADIGYSQAIDPSGAPRGNHNALTPPREIPSTGGSIGLFDVRIAPSAGGFVILYHSPRQALLLRKVSKSGRPLDDLERVDDFENPWYGSVVSLGSKVFVSYTAGLPESQSRLYMRQRTAQGYSDRVLLDEAPAGCGQASVSLPVESATNGERFALAYCVHDGGYSNREWKFAEFDDQGRPIGSASLIRAESGVDFYQMELRWDRYRDRWLVFGKGDGPEGIGLYLVSFSPAR